MSSNIDHAGYVITAKSPPELGVARIKESRAVQLLELTSVLRWQYGI
jgi:hypothetical protein